MRYFIRLRYKGTLYHGWQVQPNAHTVQAEVNAALSLLLREPVETTGCGRTDTGVHAEDFYAHFDTVKPIADPAALTGRLNALWVPDIQFRELFRVADNAHARFDATARTYEYRITHERNPFLTGLAHYIPGPLDVEQMQVTALKLLGKQDFGAFSKSRTQVKTTICTITRAEWAWRGEVLVFTISADRFLRNMVRALVGTLLETGKGKRETADLLRVIESRSRSSAGMSVPACGLFLTEVSYGEVKS